MSRPRRLAGAEQPALSREDAERLARRVLAFSKADEAVVNVDAGWNGNTRFAGGEITTSGGVTDTSVSITSTIGRKQASTQTNVLDDDGLRRAVELSERLARLAPDDPEIMPALPPGSYPTVPAYRESTAALTPETRAAAARSVIEAGTRAGAPAGDIFIAGFLNANAGISAVANSKGLFGYHASTGVTLSNTVRTPDGTGSGWAMGAARDWDQIQPATLGRVAAEKAVASRNPQAIEPGRYTVILEPAAVGDVLPLLMGSFNARTTDEGRSAFSTRGGGTKLGEKIADERVTIFSDPTDPELLARPFNDEGLPVKRTVWIENGILKNLNYSRFWAQKQGKEPTGAGGGGFGGAAGGLKFTGGTKSVDELVAGTQRGILVTRFWYIRFLDQRTVMVTGLTRDGLFLVENGRVTRSLKNFRWNDSPLFMLNRIEEIGRTERTGASEVMPALKVRDWEFTSISDAV